MSNFSTNADFTIARLEAQLELSRKREAELETLLREAAEIIQEFVIFNGGENV